jgi:hypothetical protein
VLCSSESEKDGQDEVFYYIMMIYTASSQLTSFLLQGSTKYLSSQSSGHTIKGRNQHSTYGVKF